MAKSADDAKDTTEAPADKTRATAKAKAASKSAARSGNPSKRAAAAEAGEASRSRHKVKAQRVGNPSWFVPVMLGLMLIGLVWVVTFYITQEQYPVESWGRWNLGAGFAFILAGFAMTTRWR